jgi:hypothetical protein
MAQRGRKSAASLEVVRAEAVQAVRRPGPPAELTDEQAEVWQGVTEALPADWFGAETLPLLSQYCRHVIAARRVAQLIEATEGEHDLDLQQYDTLLKMQEREGRAVSSLATRMRITQQALSNHRGNREKKAVAKPWES